MLFYMVVGAPAPNKTYPKLKINEEIIARIAQGDRAAFGELYEKTERAVYAFVLSILKNPEDTQDVVQETYLKIRAAAGTYQPQGKPMAWIFTIARNLAHNLRRRECRTVEPEEDQMENSLEFSYISDPTDRLVLQAALEILTEEERQILLLHAVSGVRHHEIAKSLGIPLSTALSRYHRALKKLRKHLEGKEGAQ